MWDVMQDKQLLICVSLARGGQKELCKKKKCIKGKVCRVLGQRHPRLVGVSSAAGSQQQDSEAKRPFYLV